MRMIRIILILAAISSLFITVFAVAIYGLDVDNTATRAFNKSFPVLPAAIVGGRVVFISEVEDRLEMYDHAVSSQSALARYDPAAVRHQILDNLIEQEIIAGVFRVAGSTGFHPSFDEYADHILSGFEKTPQEALGISEREFLENIVYPDFQERTLRVIFLSGSRDSSEYAKAQTIKAELDGGQDFTEAVRLYSEDEDSKYLGGDLGFFSREMVSPWLADAAFNLSASSTSDILVSPEGYHILRLASRDPGPPERVQLQHIFIRGPDFEKYMEKQRKNYRVYIFASSHFPSP